MIALTLNAFLRWLPVALIGLSPVVVRGAGVTVVTHGFLGNITDWIIPMLGHVPEYEGFPGTNFSCYSITIRENSQGNIVFSRTLLGGSMPLNTDSAEILIKLDWSSLAGLFGASSTEVAVAAANALLSTNLFPELGGRALAELPLHLIGHSRGGSVVSEITRFLGAQGVWVDHLTLLDPHPVLEFGDAAVRVWQNVFFAESFWQMNSDITCPSGESAFGAYNRFLSNLPGGYGCPHSDVHLWYHGTIDHTTPTGDMDATVTSAERQSWWTAAEAAGAQAGFRYSRIGGGSRFSTAEPGGQGNGRIRDGVNQFWNFGAGSSSNRYGLPANSALWPNPILFYLTGTNRLSRGDFMWANLYYQGGTTGTINARIFIDADSSPFNTNAYRVADYALGPTGPGLVVGLTNVTEVTTNIPAGEYRVFAQLTLGSRTRYIYAPQILTVLASANPPRFASVSRATNGPTQLTIDAQIGQRVIVQASGDLSAWTSIRTNIVTATPFVVVDSTAAAQRFYRAAVVP
jgi:hypothetical protein